MSFPAPPVENHKDLTAWANGTKMEPENNAIAASKRTPAPVLPRKINTDKRCSNAVSASLSFTLKIIEKILNKEIAINATQSLQKAKCSRTQNEERPQTIPHKKGLTQPRLTLHSKIK